MLLWLPFEEIAAGLSISGMANWAGAEVKAFPPIGTSLLHDPLLARFLMSITQLCFYIGLALHPKQGIPGDTGGLLNFTRG